MTVIIKNSFDSVLTRSNKYQLWW